MERDNKNTYEISLLVKRDTNAYENVRSFSPANSTNIDPSDVVNSVMRNYKPAWDELAK